jgi:hypothetical protein
MPKYRVPAAVTTGCLQIGLDIEVEAPDRDAAREIAKEVLRAFALEAEKIAQSVDQPSTQDLHAPTSLEFSSKFPLNSPEIPPYKGHQPEVNR